MAESAILVHCPMSPFFKIGEREREGSGKGTMATKLANLLVIGGLGRHWPSFRIPTKIPPTGVNFAKTSFHSLRNRISLRIFSRNITYNIRGCRTPVIVG